LMQHFARSLSFSSRIPCHSRTWRVSVVSATETMNTTTCFFQT
jgi:hypothetical protein